MFEDRIDPEGLAARVFLPRRPQLAAARAAAAGLSEPREVWEKLVASGLLPKEWLADARRAFGSECGACGGRGWFDDNVGREGRPGWCVGCRGFGKRWTAAPTASDVGIALASDPEGIVAAEALARAYVAAFAPWGIPQPSRVSWQLERAENWLRAILVDERYGDFRAPSDAVAIARGTDPLPWPDFLVRPEGQLLEAPFGGSALSHDVARATDWWLAVEQDLRVPDDPAWPEAVRGCRFAELPDPFTPLFELWRTGYAFKAVSDDTIVLVAPMFLPEAVPVFVAPELDVAELVTRFRCPERPQLAEARAAVAGLSDPRAAWETLAARGLIPSSWVGDTTREFATYCDACNPELGEDADLAEPPRRPCARCDDRGFLVGPEPRSVEFALALASDPRGVLTAEALAREIVARNAIWGGPRPARRAWCYPLRGESLRDPFEGFRDSTPAGVVSSLSRTAVELTAIRGRLSFERRALLRALDREVDARESLDESVRFALHRTTTAAYGWRIVAANRLSVLDRYDVPPSVRGRYFADLPDPIAPRLDLWRTGYVPGRTLRDDDDVLLLGAPPLPPPLR